MATRISKKGSTSSMSSSSPYMQAATLLNEMWKRRVNLKSLVYDTKRSNDGSSTMKCSATTYAQASNVLKHKSRLKAIQERCNIHAHNHGLLFVLLYELLEGPNKAIRGGGSLKRLLVQQEEELRNAWNELGKKHGPTIMDKSPISHPRYVRVNTLLSTTKDVQEQLQHLQIPYQIDPHVPDLLVVSSKDAQTTTQLLKSSPKVILQDKSSCFPALCLVQGYDAPLGNEIYLDACAAPGNKTLHLAALVATSTAATNTLKLPIPTVCAIDKDERRYKELRRRIEQHTHNGSDKVAIQVACQDFLSLDSSSSQYAAVNAVLLDPTCSGSGTLSTDRVNIDDEVSEDSRLQALADFQLLALRYAMSSFPNCTRIVYSTCSVHTIENEQVVARALQQQQAPYDKWKLVAPKCLSSWKRRGHALEGLLTPKQAEMLIRVDPNQDATGGFFVACLERQLIEASSDGAVAKDASCAISKKRTTDATRKRDDTTSGIPTKRHKTSKVEMSKSNEPRTGTNAEPKETTGTSDDPHLKKRLKKLAWKQRQRERKLQRLKANSKS